MSSFMIKPPHFETGRTGGHVWPNKRFKRTSLMLAAPSCGVCVCVCRPNLQSGQDLGSPCLTTTTHDLAQVEAFHHAESSAESAALRNVELTVERPTGEKRKQKNAEGRVAGGRFAVKGRSAIITVLQNYSCTGLFLLFEPPC